MSRRTASWLAAGSPRLLLGVATLAAEREGVVTTTYGIWTGRHHSGRDRVDFQRLLEVFPVLQLRISAPEFQTSKTFLPGPGTGRRKSRSCRIRSNGKRPSGRRRELAWRRSSFGGFNWYPGCSDMFLGRTDMTRRKYGILAGILGTAVGAWWLTRRRSQRQGKPAREVGTTIFHNAPTPPPSDAAV